MSRCELPKILLLVPTQDLALIVNEICSVQELLLLRRWIFVSLDDSTRNDADALLFSQGTVFVEVYFPLAVYVTCLGMIWDPVGQVVFR